MWKEYFYYSKRERCVLLFLVFILFSIVGIRTFLSRMESSRQFNEQVRSDEMELFLESMRENNMQKEVERDLAIHSKRIVTPVTFDPNLVDSTQLWEMGLPVWLIHRILNYRRAGGFFPNPESLNRIYGISSELFTQLKPYIVISDSFESPKRNPKRSDTLFARREKRDSLHLLKYPEGTVVNLNKADTAELKMIPGIGSGIARMLVAYRQLLGGFYRIEQLQEVEFILPEMWAWFVVEEVPSPHLDVNRASLERLRMHPYLNYYQAKVIVEHRSKRGEIKSLSQLSLYEEFTEKDLERLAYYLKFE